jgi:quinol monooxygenase YgiN
MIFIVVKWKTKPEWSDRWLDLVADFTAATRAEPMNLWFEWSRSVNNPNEFVLVEAFADGGAEPHVNSGHFRQAMLDMPQALVERPKIISTVIEGATDWSELGELNMPSD